MISYSELYREGADKLHNAGIEENELDARLLLEFLLNTDRSYLLVSGDEPVGDSDAEKYRVMIKRRAEHIPLQHITGCQDFMGLSFKVNGDVLIPRQDTECLVEEAMIVTDDNMSVLDMCTGSGCIIISLAKYKNNLKAVGADISENALTIARENAEANGVNVDFIRSDLFDGLNRSMTYKDRKFDIIVSNPPYIKSREINELMPEVKDHDPLIALDGGEDGLDFYRRIGAGAREFLNIEGRLLFEIGYDEAEAVIEILKDLGYKDIEVVKDIAGLDRVVKARV